MEMHEIQNYLQRNPKLVTEIYRFAQQLDKIQIFPPESNLPKYDSFSAKLSLKSKPWLIVVDDELLDPEQGGYYRPSSNTVFVKRRVFESFSRGEKPGEYIVAHELGHAKYRQERRHFIGNFAAFITSGILAGGSNLFVMETTNRLKVTHPDKREAADILPPLSAIATAWYSKNKILSWFLRQEEFKADEIATKALSRKEIIISIGQTYIASMMENGSQEQKDAINEFKRNVSDRLPADVSQDHKAFYEALAIAEIFGKQPIIEIFRDPYPTMLERIFHMKSGLSR